MTFEKGSPYTLVPVSMCLWRHLGVCVRVYECVHICLHVCLWVCVWKCLCECVRVCRCMCVGVWTFLYERVCVCVCVCVHVRGYVQSDTLNGGRTWPAFHTLEETLPLIWQSYQRELNKMGAQKFNTDTRRGPNSAVCNRSRDYGPCPRGGGWGWYTIIWSDEFKYIYIVY